MVNKIGTETGLRYKWGSACRDLEEASRVMGVSERDGKSDDGKNKRKKKLKEEPKQ